MPSLCSVSQFDSDAHEQVKVDIDTKEVKVWSEKDHYPSEPVFVPRPGATDEDDGECDVMITADY